ncbi:Altered inheritance of mitochondria protein 6 [Exophiala xenobiotica]|nr:Altered inheritance of mitochondria protein 6 [Exophiala xenobiotica]
MPPTRYNRFKRKPGRVRFMIDEDESSTGEEDVELGQYVQNHDELSASIPDTTKGASQSRAQRPSLSLKIPSLPSSSRSYYAKRSSRRPWSSARKRQRPASRSWSKVVYLLRLFLMLLGTLQCLSYVCSILNAFFPDELDLVSGPFKDSFMTPGPPEAWSSEDLTADVQPLMCHSHNDYWRREPLYRAIRAGCTGVESDVWHFNDELYVSHTVSGIRQNRTLKSLYLDPLKDILTRQNQLPDFLGPLDQTLNGVFATHPRQSLVLLIDFKNDPEPIWRRLESHLTYFRDKKYLTHFNGTSVVQGPLTIVVSGNAPFSRILQSTTYRDVFYDAPLQVMASSPASEGPPLPLPRSGTDTKDPAAAMIDSPHYPQNAGIYSPANSYYASVSFIRSIGYPWHSALSRAQLDLLRRQIRGAHARGLKVRYWGIPAWPVGLRNYIWRVLVREGVDYLSVDDIDAVTRDNWGPRKGGWGKKWWR